VGLVEIVGDHLDLAVLRIDAIDAAGAALLLAGEGGALIVDQDA